MKTQLRDPRTGLPAYLSRSNRSRMRGLLAATVLLLAALILVIGTAAA